MLTVAWKSTFENLSYVNVITNASFCPHCNVHAGLQESSGLHSKYVYSLEAIVFSVERLYFVTSLSPTFISSLIADGTVKNWLI